MPAERRTITVMATTDPPGEITVTKNIKLLRRDGTVYRDIPPPMPPKQSKAADPPAEVVEETPTPKKKGRKTNATED